METPRYTFPPSERPRAVASRIPEVSTVLEPIPFNRPCFVGKELWYITQAIGRMQISGDGYFTKQCEMLLEELTGTTRALLTTSCTHALELAALLLDIRQGDEVIIPSFTFVSTANAFALRGATPVLVDVRPDTMNLDEHAVRAAVTDRTRAIVPVHYAGVGCDMDVIGDIAAERGIAIVEDNAHGFLGKFRERRLGSFGSLATLSFHETKNFTCGEGGALLINDPSLIDRAEIIREKGTNRSHFFRGQVDKYTWVDVGSSYPPSDVLAAFLLAQLEAWESIQAKRRRIWTFYRDALAELAIAHEVRLPHIPDDCEHPYHLFYLLFPSLEARQDFIAYMKVKMITCVFHYQALHLSEMGKYYGAKAGDCPVAEGMSDRLVRLPLYNDLTMSDQERIVEAILSYFER